MGDAFFLFFPIFDTKYLDLFKKRKQIHDNLSEFLQNLDNIIESRRQAISENTHTSGPEGEKDLLTLMIESEMRQDGTVLSNEELRVSTHGSRKKYQ
jgi:cytochrome P450